MTRCLSRGRRVPRNRCCARLARQTSSERGHVEIAFWADAVASEHVDNRLQQDSQIQNQARVIDVPDVQSKPLVPSQRITPFDLGQAGNPGLYLMTTSLLPSVEVQVFDLQRAGTDKAHVSV